MSLFQALSPGAARVGPGLSAMVLGRARSEGVRLAANEIAALGGTVEQEDEMFTALSAVIDDPTGYGLFVMDCDGYGGLAAGRTAFAMLGGLTERIAVILIADDCPAQSISDDRAAPMLLRPPLSSAALEQALSGCQWLAA